MCVCDSLYIYNYVTVYIVIMYTYSSLSLSLSLFLPGPSGHWVVSQPHQAEADPKKIGLIHYQQPCS